MHSRDFEIRPLERAQTLPADWYTDPDIAKAEQIAIFDPSWQLMGRASRVKRVGDIMVDEVNQRSIIAVRQQDQNLKAYYNSCRHRAGPLALCDSQQKKIRCQYHGWVYDLNGQLRETPDFGEPQGFDPSRIRLAEIDIGQWQQLIFARLGKSSLALEEYLSGISTYLVGDSVEDYRFDQRVVYSIDSNWKTYVDNYLEGYHVPCLHPGLNAQLKFDQYQTEVFEHFSLQWSELEHSVIRQQSSGKAHYFFLYPNLMLNFLPGRLQTNQVLPVDENHCQVIFDYYYGPDIPSDIRHKDQSDSHRTQLEDSTICQQIQRNLSSGAYTRGRLSPRWEAAVHDFQNRLRADLATYFQKN